MTAILPDKHFFTIGDVCRITGTKPHVLRYWESQFKLLRPARRYSGHRKYTQRDIDLVNQIRFLIVERRYTLAGAKKEITRLMNGKAAKGAWGFPAASGSPDRLSALREIKKDVQDCLDLLRPAPAQPELLKF